MSGRAYKKQTPGGTFLEQTNLQNLIGKTRELDFKSAWE